MDPIARVSYISSASKDKEDGAYTGVKTPDGDIQGGAPNIWGKDYIGFLIQYMAVGMIYGTLPDTSRYERCMGGASISWVKALWDQGIAATLFGSSSANTTVAAVVLGTLFLVSVKALVARNDPLFKLPRPAYTLPLVGNTIEIMGWQRNRMYDWVAEQCAIHQRPWRMHIVGRGPSIVLATPELFEDVLKTHFDQFPKDESMCTIFRDLFGHGIFAVNGDEWRRHRHTASNLFSFQMLKYMMHEVVQEKVQVLNDVFAEYESRGKQVSLKVVLNHFTCDVFTKIGFGVEQGSLEGDLRGKPVNDFVDAAITVSRVIYNRFLTPTWLWQLKRHFSLSDENHLKKSVQFIDSLAYRIINASILNKHRLEKEAQEYDEVPPPLTRNLISMFMETNSLTGAEEEVDPKVIRDMVVSFTAAGSDTTCQSMLSFVMMMNRHPRVLKKIREELRLKLPFLGHDGAELPTMQDLACLIYLEAAIRENLRLNPAIPVTTRSASVDTVLSDGTLVPKGTRVVMSFYAAMRSKEVWGEDALEFKPERWINPATGSLITVSPFKFPAFLAGPRVCLGKKLGKIELKMMLAVVLSRFALTTVENPHEMTYQTGLTASIRGPMMINVTRVGGGAGIAKRAASA